ncbi:PQQ-like beta-propeller repeat protein, partial [Planctomycetota bacterium]|nr:PQQ-like beta-propeller repeat protein [Planctomycetota bacterium]
MPVPASTMRFLAGQTLPLFVLFGPALAIQQDETSSWPQFRGPGGHPVSEDASIPLDFGPERHLSWRAALPAGHSSPCVHGGKIFLTGQIGARGVVVGLDAETGDELWRRSFLAEGPPAYSHADAVPAVSTPCTDGERLFVYVDSYGLVA